MKKILPFVVLLLLASSCGQKRMRARSADELGKAIIEALKKKDADMYLKYYPTQSEMKEKLSDLEIDSRSDPAYEAYYYSEDKEKEEISERTLERYFEDDFARPRKNFKEILERGDDFDINWKEADFERSEIQAGTKASNYEKPAWIRVYGIADRKQFCLILHNCVRNKRGWNSGLSMSLSKQVYDLNQ